MRRSDPALKWILGYFALYLVLLKVLPVTLGSLTLALIFVLIIENLSGILSKVLKFRRWALVLISSLIFYGILAYSIYSIIPIALKEGGNVLSYINDMISKSGNGLAAGIKNEKIAKMVSDVLAWAGKNFATFGADIAKLLLSKIPDILTSVTLLVIASTYIAAVLPKLKFLIAKLFPKSTMARTERFLRELYGDMRKFVGGQMINALIVGSIVWSGMSILKLRYAGFLGLLSGVTDFIPFLGVFITAIPSSLIGISQYGVLGLIGVLVVLTIANQVESWILAPKILGDRVKLNWFLILITMLALSELYGFIGVLVSVPFLIIVRGIWREYIVRILEEE